jgi:hypothetical protein
MVVSSTSMKVANATTTAISHGFVAGGAPVRLAPALIAGL